MAITAFSVEEKAKLEGLFREALATYSEIELLKSGVKETVDATADEMDIKRSILNKAIRIAYKADWTNQIQNFDEIENILTTVGKTV